MPVFFSLPDNSFYSPSYNLVLPPMIHGASIYYYIYPGLAVVACVGFCLKRILKISWPGNSFSVFFLLTCWLFWAGVVGMQVLHQNWYLSVVHKNIGRLTNAQKHRLFFDYSYETARLFSAAVPAGSPAQVLTDLKKGQTFDVDVLPYLMFPRVDLVHQNRSPRYLILFFKDKTSPQELDGFRPVSSVDNRISLWERTHER